MSASTCPVCSQPLEADASACPYCGFKLLGSTQRFTPVSLDADPVVEQPKPEHSATLKVVRGPQTGVSFELGEESLSIGRSPQCSVFLNDMTVSREHAAIDPVDDGYVIRDTNSFNGVWVNNDSVESRRLASGDVIQIGAFCLLYQEG